MKVQWEKVEIVQKMQDYIRKNIFKENFNLNQMYCNIGYSHRHCDRVFKELIGKTPQEYVRLILISNSSQELLKTDKRILDIAMKSRYDTHEGYTRAFNNTFGITPKQYRKNPKPIPLFVQYPIKSYYSYILKKKELLMEKETKLCMITTVERPKRKLIFMRSKKANDYFSYCEEMGCEWEGLFNSIISKFDTAAILELPNKLLKDGYSKIASGVEVSIDYQGDIPQNCEIAELDSCKMIYFESEPFEKEEDFFPAIESIFKAIEKYDPKKYGLEYADDIAPRFNFGGEKSAKYAIPVRNIE